MWISGVKSNSESHSEFLCFIFDMQRCSPPRECVDLWQSDSFGKAMLLGPNLSRTVWCWSFCMWAWASFSLLLLDGLQSLLQDRVSHHPTGGNKQVVQHHLQPRQGREDGWGSPARPGKVRPCQLRGLQISFWDIAGKVFLQEQAQVTQVLLNLKKKKKKREGEKAAFENPDICPQIQLCRTSAFLFSLDYTSWGRLYNEDAQQPLCMTPAILGEEPGCACAALQKSAPNSKAGRHNRRRNKPIAPLPQDPRSLLHSGWLIPLRVPGSPVTAECGHKRTHLSSNVSILPKVLRSSNRLKLDYSNLKGKKKTFLSIDVATGQI